MGREGTPELDVGFKGPPQTCWNGEIRQKLKADIGQIFTSMTAKADIQECGLCALKDSCSSRY